jgi:uncharacterized SAM-binding protein YcdF (DUF218 family)
MNTLFFLLSKMFWTLVQPLSLLIILIGFAILALYRGRIGFARRVLVGVLCAFVLIGFFPIGNLVLEPLETRFSIQPDPPSPKTIIVLGGSEDIKPSSHSLMPALNDAGERPIYGIALATQFPDATLVFTGGSGSVLDQHLSGADVVRELVERFPTLTNEVVFEGRSRNTHENAIYTLNELEDQIQSPILLITSAYHMPRSVRVFCNSGYTGLIPYPVDHLSTGRVLTPRWDPISNFSDLSTGIREWIGLFAYYVTGRIDTFFPKATC